MAQLGDGGVDLADGVGAVAAKIVRGGLQLLARALQLADSGSNVRMLFRRRRGDGVRSGNDGNGKRASQGIGFPGGFTSGYFPGT